MVIARCRNRVAILVQAPPPRLPDTWYTVSSRKRRIDWNLSRSKRPHTRPANRPSGTRCARRRSRSCWPCCLLHGRGRVGRRSDQPTLACRGRRWYRDRWALRPPLGNPASLVDMTTGLIELLKKPVTSCSAATVSSGADMPPLASVVERHLHEPIRRLSPASTR